VVLSAPLAICQDELEPSYSNHATLLLSFFLGWKMSGVVFRLQTGIDNSNGGVCVWMNGVTNRLPQNTVLRLLTEQVREIDMAK